MHAQEGQVSGGKKCTGMRGKSSGGRRRLSSWLKKFCLNVEKIVLEFY